ncbi:hypothetical protein CHARACLAT_010604 [Characodon lateralis]|uniref:Uncharacterized protein n=1 Tax=Characodon lateralis TaxID=208331 RepID=A0ABU7DJE6_9TELE|nr:hypothetical protein [Characodon lateralis]
MIFCLSMLETIRKKPRELILLHVGQLSESADKISSSSTVVIIHKHKQLSLFFHEDLTENVTFNTMEICYLLCTNRAALAEQVSSVCCFTVPLNCPSGTYKVLLIGVTFI